MSLVPHVICELCSLIHLYKVDKSENELAGIGGLLKSLGPEPSPPIAESVFKWYTKEWAASKSEEKWHYSKHGT